MHNLTLFDKVSELSDKFKSLFIQKKKVASLENFSSVAPFEHKTYLTLIKRCMGDGFLGEKESDFLNYMLDRYEVNFLEWSHKTKWLKKEMARIAEENYKVNKVEQMTFNFDKKHQQIASNIPAHMLNNQKQNVRRI